MRVLFALPAAPAAEAKTIKGTATIDVQVRLVAVGQNRALGTVSFTGTTADGKAIAGNGVIVLDGSRLADGRFHADGTGRLLFRANTGTGTQSARLSGHGTLGFQGTFQEGTGMIISGATLSFAGSSNEGTGI
jgi:hypothetical protein